MSPSSSKVFRTIGRYALAVGSVGAAVGLRWLLTDLIGRESPFLLCLIAVAATAWYAGVGPAILATGLGMVVTAVDAGRHSIRPGPLDEIIAVTFFAIVAGALSFIADARRRSERARDASLAGERAARAELERALQSLAASEERYRLVATVTNDALWDYDVRSGRVERAEGMHRVFGYKPEQVKPHLQWWSDRIHPDDRDRVVRSFEAALASDAVLWSEQYLYQAANGSYATVADRAHVLRHATGHPLRVIGSMLDITALTHAQRALRESQTFLRRLIRTVPTLIVLLDPAGKIALFNRAAEELTGYRRRQVMGKSLAELLLPPEAAADYRRHLADPLSPMAREPLETAVRTREGQTRVVEWRFAPLPAPDSDLPYLLGTGVDVTERVGVAVESERAIA
ncbi:MAG TPA: PAS domain S-box protein [Tepidisphaeraceae bacterium]|jgi:PAS domain S-box-containing protein